MNEGSEPRDLDQEWKNRVLCSDESCIGTIGPDGRCRECGRPYEGILPEHFKSGSLHDAAPDGDSEADAPGGLPAESSVDDNVIKEDPISVTEDEWERRTLCPDEGCIGVIGPDGCCKECGRRL